MPLNLPPLKGLKAQENPHNFDKDRWLFVLTLGQHTHMLAQHFEDPVLAFCACLCSQTFTLFCSHVLVVTSDPSPPAPLFSFEP